MKEWIKRNSDLSIYLLAFLLNVLAAIWGWIR